MKMSIAYILLSLSSLFKGLGKLLLRTGINVDSLTLPGWFVIYQHIYHIRRGKASGLRNVVEWTSYQMPDEWCKTIEEMRRKRNVRKIDPRKT